MKDKYKLLREIAVVSMHEKVNIKINIANRLHGALNENTNLSQYDLLILASKELIQDNLIRLVNGTYELGDVTLTDKGRKVLASLNE